MNETKSQDKKINIKQMKANLLQINAFYNTSFNPRKRLEDYVNIFEKNYLRIIEICKLKNVDSDYFTKKYYELTLKHLSAESKCASVAITGPARFPVARQDKMHKYARQDYEKLSTFFYSIEKNIDKYLRKLNPESENDKKEKWLKEIEIRKEHQELMKRANILLKKGDESGALEILPEEFRKHINFLKKHFPKNKPTFTGYMMSNNLANIKRLNAQVEKIEKLNAIESSEIKFDGGCIKYDNEEIRFNIIFDSKPNEEIRTNLKRNGFKWSPKRVAWTRGAKSISLSTIKNILKINE